MFGGADDKTILNDFYKYNFDDKEWDIVRSKGEPPSARSGSKAIKIKDTIYFFGGYTKT